MIDSERGRIVVLTAPSGAGKTSIARSLLARIPQLHFSVSATTRPPRVAERDGIDYHFLSEERFRALIQEGALLEYEEVYPGKSYGTLWSEVERATRDRPVLLDIDVRGAVNVKETFGDEALTVFIRPPSLEALAERLRLRGSESESTLRDRLTRATLEMGYEDRFDAVVVNDDLGRAQSETEEIVRSFLGR